MTMKLDHLMLLRFGKALLTKVLFLGVIAMLQEHLMVVLIGKMLMQLGHLDLIRLVRVATHKSTRRALRTEALTPDQVSRQV
jgi:hypothetical protein